MTDDIHVYPFNDKHTHILSCDCPCEPTQWIIGGVVIFVHNSFDHRESVEWTEEILKENCC